jgi:hypothetical protein
VRRNADKILVISRKQKRPLQIYVSKYVENIGMGPKEVECEALDWIYLKYERDQWRGLMDKVLNL